jgi:hypothetical protein
MAGRDVKKQARSADVGRRLLIGMGAGAGVFFAAAAMATGATVTAAPAKADFDALIDPIIQPILTSLTDSLTAFDPSAAAELTSWSDSFLASLNSLDLALPAAADPSSSVAAAAEPAASSTTGTYDIPITVQEDTEPTVQAAIGSGPDQTLLVDTGSSGLVVPWQDLGSNDFTALENLFALGSPSSPYFGESGYSGGVDYIYLTYNDATVDYGDGTLTTTNTPIDVEIFSWPTSFSSPANFQDFLTDNGSTGILGIGDSASDGGPTTSPLEAAGFNGVTVNIPNVPNSLDEPDGDLIVSSTNPGTAFDTISGAPISGTALTETVKDGSTVVGSGPVYDDIDSGGVYGTIPSSIDSTAVAPGDTITVSDGSTVLYSYTVGTDTPEGDSTAPEVGTGIGTSSSPIDSGIEAFFGHPVYIDYANDTLAFDNPLQ